MNAPIIFCHYGNTKYLPYVLEVAGLTNPDKDIFLLGDQDNKWLEGTKNVKHYFFDDYQCGDEIEAFDQFYRLVQGKKHKHTKGGKDWVNFVFKRWFYVNNFLISQDIDDFWHFDSDNMILDSLAHHEEKFKSYDCTEQCNGMCMNGYISRRSVVLKYVRKINHLFQDNEFLKEQQREFDELNENFAFTEMKAYQLFKECIGCGVNTIRLNTIIDGSTFDDAIRQEHGMEMECLLSGKNVKKVYFSPDGRFYCYQKASDSFVKMNSLNLSWVPNAIFKIVLTQARKQSSKDTDVNLDFSQMPTLGEVYRKKHFFKVIFRRLKIWIKDCKPFSN